jgi:hypothetical protein
MPVRVQVAVLLAALAVAALMPADASARVRPKAGAVVAAPPVLRWKNVPSADRYNVQLFRQTSTGYRKVLSRFPTRHRLTLHRQWHWHNHRRLMVVSRYFWYVWPWFGKRYGRPRVHRRFVLGEIPANTSPPVVGGERREGEVLSSTSGTWTGKPRPRFSHRWQRCNENGLNCILIPGAGARTYELRAADIDHRVRAIVVGTNIAGSVPAHSAPTGVVLARPPQNVHLPSVAGHPHVGATVTARPGKWRSSREITYGYRWFRCALDKTGCAPIKGATTARYVIRAPDAAHRLQVLVEARNSGGANQARSPRSPVVGVVLPGTPLADVLRGTVGSDVMSLRGGNDRGDGAGGDDRIYGGSGHDVLLGRFGNDVLRARDGLRDRIRCGPGVDRVVADALDRVGADCEFVSRP